MKWNVRRGSCVILSLGVVVLLGALGFNLVAARGAFAPAEPVSEAGGSTVIAGVPGHRIAGRLYMSGDPRPNSPLDRMADRYSFHFDHFPGLLSPDG
jgi:hypothetical protein